MTAKKTPRTGKTGVKKLKLKKETLKDLGARGKDIKGGARHTFGMTCGCTNTCPATGPGPVPLPYPVKG